MNDYSEIMVSNVLMKVKADISAADNKDTVNKIYRQARNWVRFHCYYADACTPQEAHSINHAVKAMRKHRLRELGYFNGVKIERENSNEN